MALTAHILNGKALAEEKLKKLKTDIATSGKMPGLGIVLVGRDPASELYVSLKHEAAKQVGVAVTLQRLPEDATQTAVLETIERFNDDPNINGIIVQLPLPEHLNADVIINAIDPTKDADGFHHHNTRAYLKGDDTKMPMLVAVIDHLLQSINATLEDKTVAIVAKQSIFSTTLQHYFRWRGGRSTVVSLRGDSGSQTQLADIIVVAVGQPRFLTADMVKTNAIVIDVGITKRAGKTWGDVDFDAVKKKAAALTPVPGGVGPLTVAMLLEKTFKLATNA